MQSFLAGDVNRKKLDFNGIQRPKQLGKARNIHRQIVGQCSRTAAASCEEYQASIDPESISPRQKPVILGSLGARDDVFSCIFLLYDELYRVADHSVYI